MQKYVDSVALIWHEKQTPFHFESKHLSRTARFYYYQIFPRFRFQATKNVGLLVIDQLLITFSRS